jgi:2-phosphosulfolactate phosphatase
LKEIDVIFHPSEISLRDFSDKVAVVIDVLRATSTISMAFKNGCQRIIPVLTPEEALDIKDRIRDGSVLLGGERGGLKIEGFDLGNSPREYTRDVVAGSSIIFTTTNGTRALRGIRGANTILIGSFLNMASLCKWCQDADSDLVLVPSGRNGTMALEDVACAGMIVSQVNGYHKTDAALASELIFSHFKGDLQRIFQVSEHGRYLSQIGFEEDLIICSLLDVCHIIPRLEKSPQGFLQIIDPRRVNL